MTVAIAASLIGLPPVQHVQLAVTGIVADDVVTVWREWDDRIEIVRGAYGAVATSTAMVLADIGAPFGVTVTYRAQVDAAQATDTVTVPEADPLLDVFSNPLTGDYALVMLLAGPQDRTYASRGAMLRPAGRTRPVTIYDVRSDATGSWELWTTEPQTDMFRSLIAPGGPLVHRPGSAGRLNFSSTEAVQFEDVTGSLIGPEQVWAVSYHVVDEPDLDTVVALSTLQDLADAYAGLTLGDLAADFAALTLLDVATTDWASM